MTAQRDRLLYMLMLRQLETSSRELRAACSRLEESLEAASDRAPQTVILDWLQSELMALHHAGDDTDVGAQLLNAAVSFSNSIKD
ncbi:hypothetical protein FHG66_13985 [Rubellimicrobium rubrum]|uniref:Uncharacterized protein n=1 Tax=Rubellimicrobium rubrum TaxID=2585369 RepID=A0A5C4MVQ9_9RHOB|nr:hypothetical protein [Rubellimicrobium rubrum]TNC48458.1 hypothetical protein FHG66_13985 [Rubellimicrobium rubrum]